MSRMSRLRFTVVLGGAILVSAGGRAQTIQVETREIAAHSVRPNAVVRETSVAAGAQQTMSVFRMGTNRIGYAVRNTGASGRWTEGEIVSDVGGLLEPTVAHDPTTGDFVATAMLGLHLSVFKSTFSSLASQWEPWEEIAFSFDDGSNGYDKPMVVGGQSLPTGAEYYMVAGRAIVPTGLGLSYRRSIDGGTTWVGGPALFSNGTSTPGTKSFWIAAGSDGQVYVAYNDELPSPKIHFLVGKDQPNGTVVFSKLFQVSPGDGPMGPQRPPLQIAVNRSIINEGLSNNLAPGSGDMFRIPAIPQIASDPADPDVLYVGYSDTPTGTSTDVEIYFHRLDRVSGDVWSLGPRLQVNDDNVAGEQDQVLPAITVDGGGRIHIIWYDDRNYVQDDGAPDPKYDVFHAVSVNGGASFIPPNLELIANPYETAVDFTLNTSLDFLGDYIGISASGNVAWGVYAGTLANEPQGDPSVISANRITVTP